MRIGEKELARLPEHLQRLFVRLPNYGSDEVVEAFPSDSPGFASGGPKKGAEKHSGVTFGGGCLASGDHRFLGDSGSAARFFKTCEITDEDIQWQRGREFRSEPARNAEACLSLQSEAAASALSNAVAMSGGRLTLRQPSYEAPSTTVTASELDKLSKLVTEAILILERRFSRGQQPERLTLSDAHASIVAIQEPTGIISITIIRLKSNGYADLVTFDTIETNAEAGASVSGRRLFYSSKADSDDRLGSKHPTVKPLDLMQYLVRLVTPPKGTVLDPFAGTGTTGEAAWREGFNAILIEREPEYLADIERRMSLCLAGPDERARESIKARQTGKPQDHGPLFGEADHIGDANEMVRT